MNVMIVGGALLFVVAFFAVFLAKSDIQIIIAVLCSGFGLLAVGRRPFRHREPARRCGQSVNGQVASRPLDATLIAARGDRRLFA